MLFTKASQADQMNHLTEHLENSSNKDLSSISIKCEAFAIGLEGPGQVCWVSWW